MTEEWPDDLEMTRCRFRGDEVVEVVHHDIIVLSALTLPSTLDVPLLEFVIQG